MTRRRQRMGVVILAVVLLAGITVAQSKEGQPGAGKPKAGQPGAGKPRAGQAKDGPGSVPAAWPTYHGGFCLTGVAKGALPDALERLWRFKAGAPVEFPPVVADGRIHVAVAKGRLFTLDLHGREIWKATIPEDVFTSPPLGTDRLVIVGSRRGGLLAFDAATGEKRWRYDPGGTIQGTPNRVTLPGGHAGVVVISQADGAIHCVDPATGKGRWKTAGVERCDGSAAVGGGRIVMGSCAAALHVFSVDEAQKTVDIPLGADGQVAGGVALAGPIAFAGTRCGRVCAVDVASGKIVWTNQDNKHEAFTTPAVGADHVVFGADDGNVYCLRRDTGVKRWVFDGVEPPSSPVIVGRHVVVACGGTLHLLGLEDGRGIWKRRVSDWITSPAVVAGRVIVGADDGTVTAFGRK